MRITKGVQRKRGRSFIVYGQGGVGKTTLAADMPDPLFIPVENGCDEHNVARTEQPKTFDEFRILLEESLSVPAKTIVVDSITALDMLIASHLMTVSKVSSVDEVGGGFEKWKKRAINLCWQPINGRLDALLTAGKDVCLLGHTRISKYNDPAGEPYDRLHFSENAEAHHLLYNWADIVMYFAFEDMRKPGTEKDKFSRGKGITTGRRFLHTQHQAAYDAKTRGVALSPAYEALPPFPWRQIEEDIKYFDSIRADEREVVLWMRGLTDTDQTKFAYDLYQSGKIAELKVIMKESAK